MQRAGLKIGIAIILLGILGVGAWRYSVVMRRRAAEEIVLPTYADPGPGPRAPSSRAFGLDVGRSNMDAVNALVAERGLECSDTSVRAMMKKMREDKRKEIEEKKARGEEVDETSGASWLNKESPKEKNPQVRLSCPDTASAALADRERPTARGRLLLIFDSPEQPLRHVSYRRLHRDQQAALADFQSALAAMTAVYGPPSESIGEVSGTPDAKGDLFGYLQPIKREWHFSDVEVKVNALNFGRRGVDLLESVEVPSNIRPDAPALPR